MEMLKISKYKEKEVDDYINLQSGNYMKNKSFCEDLTEGKFSFPIIHSIRSTPRDHVIINILKQRTEDPSLKKFALEQMERTGSFEYTRKRIGSLYDNVKKEIEKLGGNQELEQVIDEVNKQVLANVPQL